MNPAFALATSGDSESKWMPPGTVTASSVTTGQPLSLKQSNRPKIVSTTRQSLRGISLGEIKAVNVLKANVAQATSRRNLYMRRQRRLVRSISPPPIRTHSPSPIATRLSPASNENAPHVVPVVSRRRSPPQPAPNPLLSMYQPTQTIKPLPHPSSTFRRVTTISMVLGKSRAKRRLSIIAEADASKPEVHVEVGPASPSPSQSSRKTLRNVDRARPTFTPVMSTS